MRTVLSIATATLCVGLRALGQTHDVPCGAVKTTTLPPCDAPAAPPSTSPLATVDGAAIAVSDLDAEVRGRIDRIDAAVAAARRAALEAEIADVRLHLEAERRGLSFADFWEAEVLRKTPPASDADLKAEFEKVKKWQPGATLEDLRPRLEGVVVESNRERREVALAESLKERFPLTPGADPNAAGLPPDAVLATVGDRTITAASAATRLDGAAYRLRQILYYETTAAVEKAASGRLLKAEADRRGLTPGALRKAEIDDKVVPPTAEDLAKEWETAKTGLKGSLSDNRPVLTERILSRRRESLELEFEKTLQAGRTVDLHLPAPPPPVLSFEVAGAPARGNPDAKVTLVEFADFECPHCAHGYEQVDEILGTHGDRVRYVFRNYPLPFHVHALKAAEAALAARAQGRFFELATLLFRNQKALDVPSLKRYAQEAGCAPARFAADLDGGRLAVSVLLERRDGERVGVLGTPAFYVNGVPVLWDGTAASIRSAVDAALAKAEGPRAAEKRP